MALVGLAHANDLGAADARMNQVQVLGSHNSYKQAIDPSLLQILRAFEGDRIRALEYSHRTLHEQLDLGLRSLELDILHDPEGGRYARPRGLDMIREKGLPGGPAYDPEGLMKGPGLKVLHIQDIDFRTSVYTLRQALTLLKSWFARNPRHLPVVITMNAKQEPLKNPEFTRPLPFDRAAFDARDAEIRYVLPAAKLITPDDVRGSYETLETAVLAHAWPTLEQARGRFMFVLDEGGAALETYVEGHPSLRGRAMFVNAEEGRPEAAFRIVNEPKEKLAYIQYLVRSGYMVRTRADADTVEARLGDYSRWQAALASGAQVITTDYYEADPSLKTDYKVRLPGNGAGRWNTLLLPVIRPLPELETARPVRAELLLQ
jgi:hypothetical protein